MLNETLQKLFTLISFQRPNFRFAASAQSCYDPQCKNNAAYYSNIESNGGCFASFWKKTKKHPLYDDWYVCDLLPKDHNLGWQLAISPSNLLIDNVEISVGLHECHEKNVLDQWGDGAKEGKFIFKSSKKLDQCDIW